MRLNETEKPRKFLNHSSTLKRDCIKVTLWGSTFLVLNDVQGKFAHSSEKLLDEKKQTSSPANSTWDLKVGIFLIHTSSYNIS